MPEEERDALVVGQAGAQGENGSAFDGSPVRFAVRRNGAIVANDGQYPLFDHRSAGIVDRSPPHDGDQPTDIGVGDPSGSDGGEQSVERVLSEIFRSGSVAAGEAHRRPEHGGKRGVEEGREAVRSRDRIPLLALRHRVHHPIVERTPPFPAPVLSRARQWTPSNGDVSVQRRAPDDITDLLARGVAFEGPGEPPTS